MLECRFEYVLPLIFGLATLGLFAVQYVRLEKRLPRQPDDLGMTGWLGIALLLLTVLTGTSAASSNCAYSTGSCPPSIGGSGYPCDNPGATCGWIFSGECETQEGYYFWSAACECYCD